MPTNYEGESLNKYWQAMADKWDFESSSEMTLFKSLRLAYDIVCRGDPFAGIRYTIDSGPGLTRENIKAETLKLATAVKERLEKE